MRKRYSFSTRHSGHIENIRRQKEKYPSLAEKIIQDSDIILEVLDARFIEDTRNKEVEELILKSKKLLFFVINKSDLKKIKRKDLEGVKPYVLVSCKNRKGTKELRDKIKLFAKKFEKEKVVVGVIGYPNTGKSSLINLLIGKSSAGVGSDAGFTKGIQKLRLSSGIVLLDSPGVIPKKEYSGIQQSAISKHTKVGARSYSQVREPEMIVADLIKDYSNVLEAYYKIDAKGDSEILLEKLGKKLNFLKKGGEIDFDKTARKILKDWQEGRIEI
jgi:hypothetical protein